MATAYAMVEEETAEQAEDKLLEAARSIIGHLDQMAREQISAKQLIEDRWLKNLRQYLGQMDPAKATILRDLKQSTAFVKLTRHKTNGWSARIGDLLFPTDDKNWGVEPTPIPRLTGAARDARDKAVAKVKEANMAAGNGADAGTVDQLVAEANEFGEQIRQYEETIQEAKRRAAWMERTIEDQFVESDFITECRIVIEDGCKLGTGILKGPLTSQSLRPKWVEKDGRWILDAQPDPRPMARRVDPWHFFPDMSATTIKEAEFTFERSLPSPKDLRRAALKFGFNKAAVRRLLKEGAPPIIPEDLSHIAELRAITGENDQIKGRWVQWEYHGPLECDQVCTLLRAAGKAEAAEEFEQKADPLDEHRVIIHFIGNEVLKIAPEFPLDSGESLYSVWNFEHSESSMFGIGVPEIMSDSQDSINNAWRMMHDNGALSVGPQIVIDKSVIQPQDGSWKLSPLKIWLLSSTSYYNSATNKPLDSFQIDNNQAEYAGLIELARSFADEETSMPDIAQGEQGAATQTLGGMSILFNSANVVFRRVVKSWDDDVTKPTIRRFYDWNMQFNPDDSIKGDMQADARGTSVLLVREIQSQNLMAIVTNWTSHPTLGVYLKPREAIVKTLQTMMIPPEDILRTQDEVDRLMREQAEQPPAPDPAMELRLQIAQIEADNRIQIENMRREVAIMKVAEETGLSREQIMAKFKMEELKIGSTERLRATEIAVEEERRSQGVDPGVGVG